MKVSSLKYLLLVIYLLEYINPEIEVKLPIIPYTIGKLSFIVYGMISLTNIQLNKFLRRFNPIFIIWIGYLIASLIYIEKTASFTNTIANFPLYVSLTCLSFDFESKKFRKYIGYVSILALFYYFYYVFSYTIDGFSIKSYSQLHVDGIVRNRHEVGMRFSIFAFVLFFNLKNRILQIVFFALCCFFLLLIESRSNFVFFVIVLIIYGFSSKNKLIYIFSILTIFISLSYLQLENISDRFDYTDTARQLKSLSDRIGAIKAFPAEFASNPFGKGIRNGRLIVDHLYIVPHNQYLHIALSGGIISILAFLSIFITALKNVVIRYKVSELKKYNKILVSLFMLIAVTLLTVEFSGFTYYLFLSLSLYFKYNVFYEK